MSERVEEYRKMMDYMLEKYGVTSMIDWLEKLDKRVSDIEEKMK